MTRYEQLAAAYPEQIGRILQLADASMPAWRDGKPTHDEPGHTLAGAFIFADTDEGHDYWANLATQGGYPVAREY